MVDLAVLVVIGLVYFGVWYFMFAVCFDVALLWFRLCCVLIGWLCYFEL